ncbi:SDR family NAD(P)-dependent oxidoreductase [Rhodococcus sp. NPDC056743]|uniref:SDR family NAD(P)-dependent oxidoreductase n=1 Tax=Rhodococcus sp. NPDC056743 TaxID=3345934 RepID=UPI00366B60B1
MHEALGSNVPVAALDVDYSRLFRLDGQRIVVLGAGGGIGEHTSHMLTSMGAELVCVDSDPASAESIGHTLDCPSLCVDVTSESGVAELVKFIEHEIGEITGFVDVIGKTTPKPLAEFTLEDWEDDFRVNTRHAFLLGQQLSPLIARSGGGSIVFVSSVWSQYSSAAAPGYGPAKAALNTWVKQLAEAHGPAGVRVNGVTPGFFLTARMVETINQIGSAAAESIFKQALLERLGQAYEVAGTIGFLMSPAAGYITGSLIPVEGGATSRDPLGFARRS